MLYFINSAFESSSVAARRRQSIDPCRTLAGRMHGLGVGFVALAHVSNLAPAQARPTALYRT